MAAFLWPMKSPGDAEEPTLGAGAYSGKGGEDGLTK